MSTTGLVLLQIITIPAGVIAGQFAHAAYPWWNKCRHTFPPEVHEHQRGTYQFCTKCGRAKSIYQDW